MVSKTAVLLIAGAGAVVVGALVLQAKAAPPPAQIANISLTASPLSGVAPFTVTFSGSATDGVAGVGNARLYFFVDGVYQSAINVTTAADGSFAFAIQFNAVGTHSCFVADNVAGT